MVRRHLLFNASTTNFRSINNNNKSIRPPVVTAAVTIFFPTILFNSIGIHCFHYSSKQQQQRSSSPSLPHPPRPAPLIGSSNTFGGQAARNYNSSNNKNKYLISSSNSICHSPSRMKSSLSSTSSSTDEVSSSSLQYLCEISKRACDALTPMIVAFYNSISQQQQSGEEGESSKLVGGGTKKQKQDNSAFTIADGAVQYLLTEHLFGPIQFRNIVGEEDDCSVNLQIMPYTVDDLIIPDMYVDVVQKAQDDIKLLSKELLLAKKLNNIYKDLTIFIDPIDGTKEFSTGLGEQCSICIGFANSDGRPVAGIVYRPIMTNTGSSSPLSSSSQPTWVAGAKSENYFDCHLLKVNNKDNDICDEGDQGDQALVSPTEGGLLTTNGSISPFTTALMKELNYKRVRSGGAGNKMMMLMEREEEEGMMNNKLPSSSSSSSSSEVVYIQDRGVSRWDTCAAQACIEAQGGMLCKLTSFINHNGKEESYTYLKSDVNLDFESGITMLTKYNSIKSTTTTKEEGQQQKSRFAMDVTEIKPYANTCGLLVLGKNMNTNEKKKKILHAMQTASKIHEPAFD